jgi:hypothetical protein
VAAATAIAELNPISDNVLMQKQPKYRFVVTCTRAYIYKSFNANWQWVAALHATHAPHHSLAASAAAVGATQPEKKMNAIFKPKFGTTRSHEIGA